MPGHSGSVNKLGGLVPGKHDRVWAERPVFGKVRYMNADGLRRKFDADAYTQKIARLATDG